MSSQTTDRAERLLCDLIALPTVNPMGRDYGGSVPVERPIVEYLERLFVPYDVELRRLPCSPIHESLLITIPGNTEVPGTLLESHIDTVPADDWLDRAFAPRVSDGRIFGRGACDDKGCVAAMVLAVIQLLESGQRPPQPVWLLAAGDEEHAQTGVKHFLAAEHLPIGRAVFGEPTDLVPVVQHKGTIRWDITVRGRSAHTSRAELGHSAILDSVKVIEALTDYQCELRARHNGGLVTGPSLTVTMIEGGRTRNMVPDLCKIAVDFRTPPGTEMNDAIEDLFKRLSEIGVTLEHSPFQCFAPALDTAPTNPFVEHVIQFCQEADRVVSPTGAPYGSDAGWMPGKVPTIVLGPGSVDQAHTVDEYIGINQFTNAIGIYYQILAHDWS